MDGRSWLTEKLCNAKIPCVFHGAFEHPRQVWFIKIVYEAVVPGRFSRVFSSNDKYSNAHVACLWLSFFFHILPLEHRSLLKVKKNKDGLTLCLT